MSIFGRWQANLAQAEAEMQNSRWLKEQAAFAQEATEREEAIFQKESESLLAEQVGSFAKNGIELSGSALDALNETENQISMEIEAIRQNGEMQMREALLKANSSRNNATQLSSLQNNLLQSGGSLLTGASGAIG